MWFKKKSVLQVEGHYDTEKSADGTTDMRTIWMSYYNNSSSIYNRLPSVADAGNYFYLPALGYYGSGQLNSVGDFGYYWSSSAYPWGSGDAYNLFFTGVDVYVKYSGINNRLLGFRVGGFE